MKGVELEMTLLFKKAPWLFIWTTATLRKLVAGSGYSFANLAGTRRRQRRRQLATRIQKEGTKKKIAVKRKNRTAVAGNESSIIDTVWKASRCSSSSAAAANCPYKQYRRSAAARYCYWDRWRGRKARKIFSFFPPHYSATARTFIAPAFIRSLAEGRETSSAMSYQCDTVPVEHSNKSRTRTWFSSSPSSILVYSSSPITQANQIGPKEMERIYTK